MIGPFIMSIQILGMNTIKKIKQKWDISLSKSYANAFKSAVVNFETYTISPNCEDIKKPAFAGLLVHK